MRRLYAILLASVLAASFAFTLPASAQVVNLPIGVGLTSTAAVTTATTTQLLASTSKYTYVYWLGTQASNTNTTSTFTFEISPVAACASSVTVIVPQPIPTPGSAGFTAGAFSGAGNASGGFQLSPVPYIIPPFNYLCMVTAGTTIAVNGVVLYVQM